jgi:hypothetical protein
MVIQNTIVPVMQTIYQDDLETFIYKTSARQIFKAISAGHGLGKWQM